MSCPASLLGAPAVLLFDSKGLVSSLIRWQTRGEVSHAGLLLPDGRCLESMQGDGVRIRELTPADWQTVEAFRVSRMTAGQWERAIQFANGELGCGYDYWAVVRFVSRRRMPKNDKWFCSELVFAALQAAGVNLLERIEASEVSPQAIRTSPLLQPLAK